MASSVILLLLGCNREGTTLQTTNSTTQQLLANVVVDVKQTRHAIIAKDKKCFCASLAVCCSYRGDVHTHLFLPQVQRERTKGNTEGESTRAEKYGY